MAQGRWQPNRQRSKKQFGNSSRFSLLSAHHSSPIRLKTRRLSGGTRLMMRRTARDSINWTPEAQKFFQPFSLKVLIIHHASARVHLWIFRQAGQCMVSAKSKVSRIIISVVIPVGTALLPHCQREWPWPFCGQAETRSLYVITMIRGRR